MNKDNKNEMFPWVDNEGNVIGHILRGEAHNGSKKLHPEVHLHVFNSQGELYLQKRPQLEDIQPGKWGTACGGHIDYGENVEQALKREVGEELGIHNFVLEKITSYIFESNIEREYVNVFATVYNGDVNPSKDELDGGRFWTLEDIENNIGHNVFTPNFEREYRNVVVPYLQKQNTHLKQQ